VKDAVGGLAGDEKVQAEGKWEKAKGEIRKSAGNVEEKLSGDD
jgi:uncharacterized protein YjbJ (UPF0337 family)